MRRLTLTLAIALTACAEPAVSRHPALDGLLARLEAGDNTALVPAVQSLINDKGNTEAHRRFAAALPGVPQSRAQVLEVLAPPFPAEAERLIAARTAPLSATASEPDLAEAVVQAAARQDDWVVPAPTSDRAAAVVRIRRIEPGDTFHLVLRRGREPARDAIRHVDCPTPACTEAALARTVLDLLAQ